MEINRQAEELKANVEVAPAQPPNPTPKTDSATRP
jgi:hypothetical protein